MKSIETLPRKRLSTEDCLEGRVQLPLGIPELSSPHGRVRDVELHEFTDLTLELMHDRRIRSKGPFMWMLRALSLCIDKIGDYDVFREYEKNNYREHPKILEQLPVFDTAVVFVGSQVYNYGSTLEGVQIVCPSCSKQFAVDLDLSDMEIVGIDPYLDRQYPLKIDLVRGLPHTNSSDGVEKFYDVLFMHIPQIRHALPHLDFQRNEVAFSRRMYYSATEKLETRDGTVFPESDFKGLGVALYNGFTMRDRRAISKAVEEIAQLDSSVNIECRYCLAPVRRVMDSSFFFQA